MLQHKIDWFSDYHEMLTTSDELLAFKPFTNYLDLVASGKQPVSESMMLLINNVIPIILDKMDAGEIYLDSTAVTLTIDVPATVFPYKLYDWEDFMINFMCGFRYSDDDTLVYNEYFMYMARGAGKNGFMSWVIFALISKINPIKHYDVAVSASSERQAKTSFLDIHDVLADVDPNRRTFKRSLTEIEHLTTRSNFQYLSSNGKTADGLRLGMVYIDELHAIDSYSMLNVLKSALGKIPDARTAITSTDGYVRGSVLDDYKDTGSEILNGNLGIQFPRTDERHSRMLPFMHHIDDPKEVKEYTGWLKANPSVLFNKSLLQQYRDEVIQIDRNAELNLEFFAKRVNHPKQDSRFVIATYDELQQTRSKSLDDYINETGDNTVDGVVDYADTKDLTTAGILAIDGMNDNYYYEQHSFITNTCETGGVINPEILRTGHSENKLTTVYTKMIDPSVVVEHFNNMSEKYYIRKVYIDQYKSTILKPALEQAGYTVEVVRVDMKAETQLAPLLDKMFTQNRLFAGEDSLFRWAVGNLYKNVVSKGIRFDKIEPKARKTDPASALFNGLIGVVLKENIVTPLQEFTGHMIT